MVGKIKPIGVLALQGDVSEHLFAFEQACAERGVLNQVIPVRCAGEIQGLLALAIPGGESTTILRLIDKNGMRDPISRFQGGIFATCAGMVVLARTVVQETRFEPLGVVDITVDRNAFGRQRDSFEADIEIKGLSSPYHAVFIRAPVVREAGEGVNVLASVEQGIVAIRSGLHMILAFHPEIGGDLRLHHLFLDSITW